MSRGVHLHTSIQKLEDLILRHPEIGPVNQKHFSQLMGWSHQTVGNWVKTGHILIKREESSNAGMIDPLDTLERWKKIEAGELIPKPRAAEIVAQGMEEVLREATAHVQENLAEAMKIEPTFPAWIPEKPPEFPKLRAMHFDEIRARAIKAAKEAYRDEILEAADCARAAGIVAQEVALLREFVDADEKFRVVFEERK